MGRRLLIWALAASAVVAPIAIAATSPLLAWRDPIYIAAGLAGVVSMALLLLQPLFVAGALPGARLRRGRALHAWCGGALTAAVVLHVVGLWLTSPPDVVDALLFRSPTPFSLWGVIAMWAVFATAFIAALRRRFRLSPSVWRTCHLALAIVIVVGGVVHAMLIEGTMELISKTALCALTILAAAMVILGVNVRRLQMRRSGNDMRPDRETYAKRS